MSYLKQGAWINADTGEWTFIDEHSDWAKRTGNLVSIGLPDSARQAIADIPNDYAGENRKKILLTVMAVGGIRMRGHGDVLVFEFTVPTTDALRASRDVLKGLAGEFTRCRFHNLTTSTGIEVPYSDYRRHIENDIDWLLGQAETLGRS